MEVAFTPDYYCNTKEVDHIFGEVTDLFICFSTTI